MKQLSSILSLGAIALLATSCASSQKEEPPAPTSQQPRPPVSQAAPKATFGGAIQPGRPASNQIATAGLIPSTNPDRRRLQVAKGRNDPFAIIPVQPTFQPPESQSTKAPPKLSAAPPKRPIVTNKPYSPAAPLPPALPPLPELAQAVVVFGVIQIDGTPQIIVKAPNEQFTRYVGTGQSLANGQVRVKRIEGLGSPTPVVVLEQLGQEVYKQVGEGIPEPSASPGKAAAVFLPDWEGG